MIKLVTKIDIGLDNRDGTLFACQDEHRICYLVLEADTLHNEEVFEGMGSTEHKVISEEAFKALI